MTNLDRSNNGDVVDPQTSLNVRQVGLAQRLLLWAVLASFVSIFFPLAMLVVIPFQLYCVYHLAKALNMSTAASAGWLIAMFVPGLSLICLLVLNSKATKGLKQAGIRVGLMGATVADLPAT